jgi:bZIP transcription factor
MMDQPDPSDARKRRRELLALQRTVSTSPCTFVTCREVAPSSTHESSASKKPQMKYDPDVPMTKEEAAIWRREQRRQRNRLSAAQSRERQRYRIAELEHELDQWKGKYAAVQAKIDSLLAQQTSTVTDDEARATSPIPSTVASKSISPTASPTSCVSMVLEPSQDEKFDLIMSLSDDDFESATCNTSFLKPLKMISRLAMSSITINS